MSGSNAKMKVFARAAPRGQGRTCVDLFSGAGGLAVGFREAGWCVLAGNDSDPDAGATFRMNFPEATFYEGSISALTHTALLKECGLKAGELDCLIGGPPCQSFSFNNHQRSAKDARARLFRDYLRLVARLRPKTLVMENVPGILTIGDRSVIDEIASKLASLAYDCAVTVLSAEEFGAPQIRRRVFIVASRIGAASALLPLPTHQSAALRRHSGMAHKEPSATPKPAKKKKVITVKDAIGDLPILRNGGGSHSVPKPKGSATSAYQRTARRGRKGLANHICHTLTERTLIRISHVPEGGNWRDIPRRLLPAGMKRAHLKDHTKRYGRLSRKGLASTILTKCDPHWGAYIHPTQNRTISVREAARLQGFPDRFVFAGEGLSAQYTQVGNAVPVPIARAIGERALRHLAACTRKKSRLKILQADAKSLRRRTAGRLAVQSKRVRSEQSRNVGARAS
jgi:DNA (cytosine-5)-methyltransferase 1